MTITDAEVEAAIPHLRNLNIANKDGWRQAVRNALLAASQARALISGEGWQDIATAPVACTVLATYFNPIYDEWIVEIIVAERAAAPFTHWQLITSPDDDRPQPPSKDNTNE